MSRHNISYRCTGHQHAKNIIDRCPRYGTVVPSCASAPSNGRCECPICLAGKICLASYALLKLYFFQLSYSISRLCHDLACCSFCLEYVYALFSHLLCRCTSLSSGSATALDLSLEAVDLDKLKIWMPNLEDVLVGLRILDIFEVEVGWGKWLTWDP